MLTWLWVVGLIAVGSPVLIGLLLDHVFTRSLNRLASQCENAQFAERRAEALRAELEKAHRVIEEHETLITALWHRTLGFDRTDPFRDGLPEHLGVRPSWDAFRPEFTGPVAYLVRYKPFPWGTSAENLYFPALTPSHKRSFGE